MAKIITDEKLVDEFLERGVEAIYPTKEALKKKLMSGERLRIYQGFDPTGPYLHIGHAIGIRAMRILQKLGHEIIFLVGDYTAKVGDPDKDISRKMLTDSEIKKNMSGWKKQASQLIDFGGKNPVRFERNYKWLSKLTSFDMLRLMSNITLPQILQRDLFKKRLESNDALKLHEIVYPLLQGYDSVALKVDMEIGGADQTFNMLVGRDLSRAYLNKEKFVRANKMMDAPDGKTMSKTKGNGINLADTSEEMFGKAMSYSDQHILVGFELLTEVSMEEIAKIKEAMKNGENPMIFKKKMAYEIVRIIKGEKEAQKAREYFEKVFSKKETPKEVASIETPIKISIIKVMVKEELAKSHADAKRKIEQGGVSIGGKKIIDINAKITKDMNSKILKVGKREFRKIVIK